MRKLHNRTSFSFLFLLFPFFQDAFAQSEKDKLSSTILKLDSLFWKSYNECNTEAMPPFFTRDVEFYHDKGGITLGADNLIASVKNNLCGNNNFRIRREAVKGSLKIYPLENQNVIYGAILSGEHFFYSKETGKEESLDGLASFTHLWLLKDSIWKMARILSYDHGPASRKDNKPGVTVSDQALSELAGTYKGAKSGIMNIQKEKGGLKLSIEENDFILIPESANRFFIKDRDLYFEFVRNDKKQVSKMRVIENGKLVEEALVVNASKNIHPVNK